MFLPSRDHLQVDISNILGRIQIMCGRKISILTGFCYRLVTNTGLKMTPQRVETFSWSSYYFYKAVCLAVVNLPLFILRHIAVHKFQIPLR